MFKDMIIQSHKGPYTVKFYDGLKIIEDSFKSDLSQHFIIDANVARLYPNELSEILGGGQAILIEALEDNKAILQIIPVIERLIENKIRRGHTLVAIGGGITQDITCFIASTLLRGVPWVFFPTTLLSQADSCIGSKSSINVGPTKNILGTFNPPREIYICPQFLDTLDAKDNQSGIGEILKVHAIDGKFSFDRLAGDYDQLVGNRSILFEYIQSALLIKKKYIEFDEFDQGIRNIFNYGHSFGHAIESATKFEIPHGVAVAMGMDMANRISELRGILSEGNYSRMHKVLSKNYASFSKVKIDVDDLLSALMKDKKNTATKLVLIFAVGEESNIERIEVDADEKFRSQCLQFLKELVSEYP